MKKKTLKNMRYFLVILATLGVMLYASLSTSQAGTYHTTHLTDNNFEDGFPQINNNGQVVWQGYDIYPEIFLYDGTKTIQLTDNSKNDEYPQINDSGQVVWIEHAPDIIHFYDGSSIIQIPDTPIYSSRPLINESGYVVWFGKNEFLSDYEIFLYDGTTTIQLTDNSYEDINPIINDSGQVVWRQPDENGELSRIYLYDGTTNKQLTDYIRIYDIPYINNSGQVVWCAYDGSDSEIFLFNGSTTIQLTNNSITDKYPQINNSGQVVWSASDGSDDEIFLYDGTTTIQLTDNTIKDYNPRINGSGHVVWMGFDGSDDEIFLYDGTTTVQLTHKSYNDSDPRINNNGQIVWIWSDGFDREIFLATPDSTCTDADGDRYAVDGGECGVIDCDDTNATTNPSTFEVCGDLSDNDCDGFIDCDDSDCGLDIACPSPYTFTTIDIPGTPYGINKNREIVGSFSGESGTHRFLYNGSTFTILYLPEAPGYNQPFAYGINDSGIIVGSFYAGPSSWMVKGFIYDGSSFTTIEFPEAHATHPMGINNSGQISGWFEKCCSSHPNRLVPLPPHGFFYDGVSYTALDPPDSEQSWAYGINDDGLIVKGYKKGVSSSFLYDGTGYTSIKFPTRGAVYPRGINNSGKIVGIYQVGKYKTRGFVYDGSFFRTIAFPGADYTEPYAINSLGDVVGTYRVGDSNHGFLAIPLNGCTDSDDDGFYAEGGNCGETDCDDTDGLIHPAADETCNDNIDNDCDGQTDCNDSNCSEDPVCSSDGGDGGETGSGGCSIVGVKMSIENAFAGYGLLIVAGVLWGIRRRGK